MKSLRRSGVLAHITSLPSREGLGVLGASARRFVDFLAQAGQSVWQILPLNAVGRDGAPYSALTSFAGANHVISLEELAADGWLNTADLAPLAALPAGRMELAKVLAIRAPLLAKAAEAFKAEATGAQRAEFEEFRSKNTDWLEDYALFRALLEAHDWRDWSAWSAPLRDREPLAIAAAREAQTARIEAIAIEQFFFDRQWRELRAYSNSKGIEIFGDLPIYVAQTSADVWTAPHFFNLTPDGKPITVAGCPPDAFSDQGQRWGNPTYAWEKMAADGFSWWLARMRRALALYDLVRVDHFRAFASYWDIPAADDHARNGVWVKAPGAELFSRFRAEFGDIPIVAEDLGFITPDVYELRDAFDLPGMRILQFELESEPLIGAAAPPAFPARSVAYLGNHDNDTAMGFVANVTPRVLADPPEKRPLLRAALASPAPHWALLDILMGSGSDLAIAQMQDLLGLDGKHRTNIPGTIDGNWAWRFDWDEVAPSVSEKLRDLTAKHRRLAS